MDKTSHACSVIKIILYPHFTAQIVWTVNKHHWQLYYITDYYYITAKMRFQVGMFISVHFPDRKPRLDNRTLTVNWCNFNIKLSLSKHTVDGCLRHGKQYKHLILILMCKQQQQINIRTRIHTLSNFTAHLVLPDIW